MAFWDKTKSLARWTQRPLFKAEVPKLDNYIGRRVTISATINHKGEFILKKPERVTIETIVGNKWHPTYYEINGKHLISMLRFHAQMEGDTSITEEQFRQFEAMEVKSEDMRDKKGLLS